MRKNNTVFAILSVVLSAILLGSCGGGGSSSPEASSSFTYATTSTRGDYTEWTLDAGSLNATWQIIDDTGLTDYTFTLAATCAAEDSYGMRNCGITAASCTDGVSACPPPPSGSLDLLDAPGVALFVTTDAGTVAEQLHVGFAKNNGACSDDVSGDYTFIRTGLGLNENFGMYRTDANAISIIHSDFGFDTPDNNTFTQTVAYRTSTESEMFADLGCADGVRVRDAGGNRLRLMVTTGGLFVLDLPAGQGGLLSFKTSNAASLADFAGKTLNGISFPDNDVPQPVLAEFGAVAGSQVNFTATSPGGVQNLSIKDLATTDSLSNPTYPDFAVQPAGYGGSVLAGSYTDPDAIPGLFKLDGLGDSGRVIMGAMKFGSKMIGVGMVYNYRTTTDIDPSAGDGVTTFVADGLYNTGNFIVFER